MPVFDLFSWIFLAIAQASGVCSPQLFWQGMWLERIGGLYIPGGGQAFNPRIDRWMQPQPTTSDGYRYTEDQLSRSGAALYWDALWNGSDYGVAGQVTNPEWVEWVGTAGWITAAVVATALTGGSATAFYLLGAGVVAGAGIGGAISVSNGGTFSEGAREGAEWGSFVGAGAIRMTSRAAVGLGRFALAHPYQAGAVLAIGWSLATPTIGEAFNPSNCVHLFEHLEPFPLLMRQRWSLSLYQEFQSLPH